VKVEFRESFAKDLKGVTDKGVLSRAKEVIKAIEQADSLAELFNLKKLRGGGSYFRLRVGDYRIGVTLEDDTVIFVRFLNRKDIYRYFP
jgi:mRNA interferase RelE/StbE